MNYLKQLNETKKSLLEAKHASLGLDFNFTCKIDMALTNCINEYTAEEKRLRNEGANDFDILEIIR